MRILIIEDDALTAADISASLADGGHDVVAVAETSREAVALAGTEQIDLAVVDIGLRDGGTGLLAVDVLRRRFRIPSLLVSAERDLRAKAASVGALGWIPKPARPSEILRSIQSLCPADTRRWDSG